MSEEFDMPKPVVVNPPGGSPMPYVEPPDGVSAELLGKIAHDYIHTDKKVDSIAVDYGLTTRDVRSAIKRYGLDKRKAAIIQQQQQEELAAYSKFLLDNRVNTAEQHLRISSRINDAVENLLAATKDKTPDEIAKMAKPLKDVASLFRSLSETLSAASGVGARAVALTGLPTMDGPVAVAGGKKSLVNFNFTVMPQGNEMKPVGETIEGELL